jgi:branched-chain amino acid aminotransferase
VDWEDATIHVMSHVVHYGSSVFEGIRCYQTPAGGAVFRLPDHMRRLVDSARIYRIPMSYSVEELVQGAVDTVAANDLQACYLRPVVVRTGERMGVFPDDSPESVETFIIAWHWVKYLGEDAMTGGVDVCVSSWRRPAPDTLPAMAKAGGNYLNSQLAVIEARQNGYVEGILLDAFGHVSEGSGENIFVVRGGVVYTTPLAGAILNGITRDSVMRIARDLGHEVREAVLPRELLYVADEVFFTGTAAEVTPIRSIDRIPVGEGRPGPITKAIQQQFMDIAQGRVADPYGWLTPVPEAAALTR